MAHWQKSVPDHCNYGYSVTYDMLDPQALVSYMSQIYTYMKQALVVGPESIYLSLCTKRPSYGVLCLGCAAVKK